MPVNKAASILKVYSDRIWTIFNYQIEKAIMKDDQSAVKSIGTGETSSEKGHSYVTVAVDPGKRRVIC